MYAVRYPDGMMTFFNRGMCSVYDSPLHLAERCAARCGGTVMVDDHRPYCFTRDGVPVRPRWTPLNRGV